MELVIDSVRGDRRRNMTSRLRVNFTYLVGSKLQNYKNKIKRRITLIRAYRYTILSSK